MSRLSDIDLNLHGFTEDDVIEGRLARDEMIREAAIKGNPMAVAAENLESFANSLGIHTLFDENLDDEDTSETFY